MDAFWVVTLFHYHPPQNQREALEASAVDEFECLGIEEYSLSEPEVDALLGERSYSGGDLPEELIEEVELRVLNTPQNYRFFFRSIDSAEDFYNKVKAEHLCESQLEEKEAQDWNLEWKKHYAPIQVNEKLEIIPSWSKDYKSKSQKQIYIYPGMGFGTGSHETTFLCLKLFTENLLNKPLSYCLDFGSGSGILGLSAFLFSNEVKVDFYDIDPEANKNCYQNAVINQLESRPFRLLLPEVRDKLSQEYDVVFANILENILYHEKKELIRYTRPGGALILSGLLRHQVPGIIEAYQDAGMHLKSKLEKGDWAALLLERPIL